MPAWRALRGAGSVTDRSCSLQRMVSTGKSETFDGMGVTWGCARERSCKVRARMAGK